MNPLHGWTVGRDQITFVGDELQRPECVLAERDGTLWSADARGGVMRIDPDGRQSLIAQTVVHHDGDANSVARYILQGTLPNGLAFDGDGNFVIANFGTDAIEHMTRSGHSETLFTEIEGKPIGKANFALADSRGRIWITVHTRRDPWTLSVNEKTPDGYIALIDSGGAARIVADGFIGTNEIRFDAAEEWLYVVESNARHISRLRAGPEGSLSDREIYGPADLGGVPDGFAFDELGNLWITLVNADRLIALTPEGEVLTLLDDGDPEGVAAFDAAFFAGTMTPEVLGAGRGTLAPMMASVTFGEPDLKTVYLGSLMGSRLPSFRSPVAGLPLAHWHE
ncbi:MAG TPA: SMP-30/gluconolactonase/LRE family protein [Solirubrobacteraceae bacterium]